MKRSRSIRLVLLGSVGLIGLAGCDQPDPTASADFIQDSAACEKTQNPDACRQGLVDARARHYREAPRFASRAECETQMGPDNCELAPSPTSTTSTSSSSGTRTSGFSSGSSSSSSSRSTSTDATDADTAKSSAGADPARTAGASAADATTQAATPHATSSGGYFVPMMMGYMMGRTLGGGAAVAPQPVYRDANNTAFAGGKSIGAFKDPSLSSSKKDSKSSSSSTSSRGGFGSSSSSYSSSS